MMKKFAVLFAALSAVAALGAGMDPKPNFVIIFADDLGYGDLGCYGHPSIRTPNLDRMAREGMRFTDFYSAAEVCTPSRAALLTGRYPIRSGMCNDRFRVLRRESTGHLPESEITLAELLKEQGYKTAIVGKWHLGNWMNNPSGHPLRHGFDVHFGLPHSNDMNPVPGIPKEQHNSSDPEAKWFNAPLFEGERLVEQPADQTTLTRRYTEFATKFIRENKAGPFFLYMPHTFPHTPLFASDSFRDKSPRGRYGDVVEELDWSVGRICDALREARIERNTLVFFTSDNGPWLIRGLAGGSAGLLRDGKGSTFEGGMRVPGLAWMPGRVPAGSTCHDLTSTMDLFPTFAAWAGAKVPADRKIDGKDISALLLGLGSVDHGAYFFYRGTQLFAARMGNWKAHFITQPSYGPGAREEHNPPLLFDLAKDPSESFDVAMDHPDILANIDNAVADHRTTLQAVTNQLEAVVAQQK